MWPAPLRSWPSHWTRLYKLWPSHWTRLYKLCQTVHLLDAHDIYVLQKFVDVWGWFLDFVTEVRLDFLHFCPRWESESSLELGQVTKCVIPGALHYQVHQLWIRTISNIKCIEYCMITERQKELKYVRYKDICISIVNLPWYWYLFNNCR